MQKCYNKKSCFPVMGVILNTTLNAYFLKSCFPVTGVIPELAFALAAETRLFHRYGGYSMFQFDDFDGILVVSPL